MLKPIIALLNRLSFSGKFLLTVGIALIPILYLLAMAIPNLIQAYAIADREVKGISFLQTMQPALIATQKHRGLSNAWLSGDAAAEPKVRKAAADMQAALVALNARAAENVNAFGEAEGIKTIGEQWSPLAAQGADTPAPQSFATHTKLVDHILDLAQDMAFRSGLTLDPEADSFYLQDSIVNQAWPLIELLGKTRGKTAGILARKAITPDEKAQVTALTAQIRVYAKNLANNLAYAMEVNPSLRERLAPLSEAMQEEVRRGVELTMSEAVAEGFTLPSTEYFAAATRPIDAAIQFTDVATKALTHILEGRKQSNREHMVFSIALTLVMLGLTGYIVLGMHAGILQAVGEVNLTSTALAAGDLSRPARVASRDELGRIATDVNRAREALAQLIQSAKDAADQVDIASHEVAAGSNLIAQATTRQSEAISSAAASVEELTVSVSHTADQTQDANATADEAGRMSDQGQSVANEASREMIVIAQAVRDAARQIEGLNVRADEISGIVQVIKDIADQTNLLALNAAIEAARAGEQGRGFAVVADEVRKLAERTSGATTQITGMISAIQQETRQAVTNMDASSQRAEVGERSVGETARVLTDIHGAAELVREKVDEIASASREQRIASTEIAQNVERIAQMVEENSASSEQVSTTAAHLGDLAARLKSELDQFKV
ncbi:MAG: HAMP domain-containing protein [Thiobacillus sp.]|nr:HAMP domain-containing protein [Thiobacillus sp.]